MSQRKPFTEKNFLHSQAFSSHDDAFGLAAVVLADSEGQSKPAKTIPKPIAATSSLSKSTIFKFVANATEKWGNVGLGIDLSKKNTPKP